MTTQKDIKNRSWMVTIPVDSIAQDDLIEDLKNYSYIGQMEQGNKTQYLHWQIYIENETQIRFSTLRKKFPKGHFEVRRTSKANCYNYVTKSKTAVPNTIIKNGEIDITEARTEKLELNVAVDLIEGGARVEDILLQFPSLANQMKYLDRIQEIVDKERYGRSERDLKVYYLYGEPGCGKTSYIYNTHGYESVYRVTNWKHPFDQYKSERVLVLDEFYDSLSLDALLNVIDRYPVQLPARYYDRWAAYNIVYIVSNRKLPYQYQDVFHHEPNRANSLYRRISDCLEIVSGQAVAENYWLDRQVPPENRI